MADGHGHGSSVKELPGTHRVLVEARKLEVNINFVSREGSPDQGSRMVVKFTWPGRHGRVDVRMATQRVDRSINRRWWHEHVHVGEFTLSSGEEDTLDGGPLYEQVGDVC
jgi:hypothetical protein